MADSSDVAQGIVDLLDTTFYPNGDSNPSVVGNKVNIQQGWPTEADIRAAVAGDFALVRVYAVAPMSGDVTRYPRVFRDVPSDNIALVATLLGNNITFSGTPNDTYFVGVECQGVGYSYPVQASDTLSSIAAALAAAIPGAASVGPVLSLPTTGQLPNVVVTQSGLSVGEVGRIAEDFLIATWAPTPQLRNSVLTYIASVLNYSYRLTLGDIASSIATLMDLRMGGPDDVPSRAGMWRRDVRATYDFPITYVITVPPVTVGVLQISAEIGDNTVSEQTYTTV